MKRALMPFAAPLTVLALLATLPACSSEEAPRSAGPEPASSSRATPTPSATPAGTRPGSPVDGTWHAGPFPLSRVADAMDDAGLGKWFDVLDLYPAKDPETELSYDLKIQDDVLLMAITFDGKPLGVVDRQGVDVRGKQVTFRLEECGTKLRWTKPGERLTLRLVDDDCPDYKGTPNEAYITALYASVPFESVG